MEPPEPHGSPDYSQCASYCAIISHRHNCCGTVFAHCFFVPLSLVDKELTSLYLDRKRLGRRARLGGRWEEETWHPRSRQPDPEAAA